MDRPSAEQLRTLDARQLREQFEFGLQEAKRLKIEQRVKDNMEQITHEPLRRIILDMLFLITGRAP